MKKKKFNDYINPLYADKQKRTELGFKSLICFGTKSKWFKLSKRLGLDIESIDKQMDEIIKLKGGKDK